MSTELLPADCDLLAVGSGAAGLAAAISAAHAGLKPVIIEKSEYFGGSTAISGGAIWVPDNPIMRAAGMKDDPKPPAAISNWKLVTASTRNWSMPFSKPVLQPSTSSTGRLR